MLSTGVAIAKLNLITDYQAKGIYSKRNNEPTSSNDINKENMLPDTSPQSEICAASGYKARADLGLDYVCVDWYYGPVTCCRQWKCNSSTYPYTATTCTPGKNPSEACNGNDGGATRYKRCS